MVSVWKKWDSEAVEGYIAACKILEDGEARFQVLGDHVVRVICYGGKKKILPALYLDGVPDDWVATFKLSHKDAEVALASLSDKPAEFLDVYEGRANEKEFRDVVKDVLEDWDKDIEPDVNRKDIYAWRYAGSLLRRILTSHFPKRGGRK